MNADGPSPNGPNGGRDAQGRFAKGWKGGPGNPHAKHTGELRSALLKAISPEDLEAIVAKLIEQAKGGDVASAKELFDRIFGRPNQPIEGLPTAYVVPELTHEEMRRAREIAARADAVTPEELRAVAEGRKNPRIYDPPTWP